MSNPTKCPTCGGTGRTCNTPRPHNITQRCACPDCKGTGEVAIEQPEPPTEARELNRSEDISDMLEQIAGGAMMVSEGVAAVQVLITTEATRLAEELVRTELTHLGAIISLIPDPDVGPSEDFVMAEQQLQRQLAAYTRGDEE